MISPRPLFSEKTVALVKTGWYTFAVDSAMRKEAVRRDIADRFGVTVTDVRSHRMHGKERRAGRKGMRMRKPDWKKVMVRVAKGQSIAVFTQVTEQVQK